MSNSLLKSRASSSKKLKTEDPDEELIIEFHSRWYRMKKVVIFEVSSYVSHRRRQISFSLSKSDFDSSVNEE